MQLTPAAAPFAAFRTASILPREFLKIEHAVQVILDHLVLDSEVVEQSVSRAKAEGIDLPLKVTDRLSQLFIEGP